MVQEKELINSKLSEINSLISPYQLAYVSPGEDTVYLEQNARSMDKRQFNQLVDNVKNDKFLSQLPFCEKLKSGKYKILSGNHRVKAASKAGLEYVLVLYVDEIDEQKSLGYQLSHNSLVGKDDVAILKDIYSKITELEIKQFAGINEMELFELKVPELKVISDADIELNEIRLLFSDLDYARVNEITEKLNEKVFDEKKDRIVFANFYRFVDVMTRIKLAYNIKNHTVSFIKMIEICEIWLEEQNSQTN